MWIVLNSVSNSSSRNTAKSLQGFCLVSSLDLLVSGLQMFLEKELLTEF